jgi:plasmid maintenance system antidote protein VapI
MEIREEIPNFSNYQASNLGKICNNFRILKGYKNRQGYINHTLINDNNQRIKIDAHIVVCLTFHGKKPSKTHTVDHINGNPSDNRIDNLRWATKSEQAMNTKRDIKSRFAVEMINSETNEITKIYSDVNSIADELKIHVQTIRKWINNKTHITNGCYFRYKKLTNLEDEKWKQLSDNFWISTKGRIKDKQERSLCINIKNGYQICAVDGKFEYIHRLVAKAFIENPNNYTIVNHIDNNGLNNSVDNLEWCTPKHNTEHGVKCNKDIKKDKIFKIDITTKQILKTYSSITEAAKDENIHQTSMSGRIKRKTEYDGYIFSREPLV